MRASDFNLHVIAVECDYVGREVLRLLTVVSGDLDITFDFDMTSAKDIAGDFSLSFFLSDLVPSRSFVDDVEPRVPWHKHRESESWHVKPDKGHSLAWAQTEPVGSHIYFYSKPLPL